MNRPATLTSRLASLFARLMGWTILMPPTPAPKLIGIAYPHTHNWDLLPALIWAWSTRTPLKFVAKHSLFRPPMGWLIRAWGGVAVDRRKTGGNFVAAVAQMIEKQPEIVLGLAPEGTRKYTDHWKTGFYHMAQAANVPMALIVFDWPHKRFGILDYVKPTGNIEADIATIARIYEGCGAKVPASMGPIRLKDDK